MPGSRGACLEAGSRGRDGFWGWPHPTHGRGRERSEHDQMAVRDAIRAAGSPSGWPTRSHPPVQAGVRQRPAASPSHRYWHLRLVPLRTRRKVGPDPERLLFVTKGDRMLEHLPIPRHEDQVAQVPNDTIGRELLGTIHKPILPGLADPHPCLEIDVPCRPGSGNIARDRQARRRYGSPRIHWPA